MIQNIFKRAFTVVPLAMMVAAEEMDSKKYIIKFDYQIDEMN